MFTTFPDEYYIKQYDSNDKVIYQWKYGTAYEHDPLDECKYYMFSDDAINILNKALTKKPTDRVVSKKYYCSNDNDKSTFSMLAIILFLACDEYSFDESKKKIFIEEAKEDLLTLKQQKVKLVDLCPKDQVKTK